MTLSTSQTELDALRKLNPQAIGAVYDSYYPDVYRFVRYRLDDETTAEDIASEVFVRLLEAVKSGQAPRTNLKAWLLGTALASLSSPRCCRARFFSAVSRSRCSGVSICWPRSQERK